MQEVVSITIWIPHKEDLLKNGEILKEFGSGLLIADSTYIIL